MGLQVAVELLKRGAFEVSEIEVVDGEVIDEQLGDLDEFSGNRRRVDYRLFSNKVDEILSEGQDDHIESRRSLEMVLLIIFLFLRENCSKAELLVVSGD